MRVAGTVLLGAFLALVVTVLTSPSAFVYDEPEYMNYVPLLQEHGLTEDFLDSLTGGAGPLYAFVHFILSPLTGLSPIGMRLVNVILLVVVAAVLAAWLKHRNCADYLVASGSILVVPMTWVLTGMALTEMPAMVFATLSLYAMLRGVEALEQGAPLLGWFIASGILLGAAVWGRQPVLVLVAVPVVLAVVDRRLRIPALAFVVIVSAFTLPLVVAWEGFTPPSEEAEEGLSFAHGLISLGYAGVCFLVLVPRLQWLSRKYLIVGAVVVGVVNAALGIVVVYPLQSIFDDFLPDAGMTAYGLMCGSLLAICGVLFFLWILQTAWQSRHDLKQVTIHSGLLCLVLSPALIENYYSSRYTAMALPYLVLAAQPWRRWNWKTNIMAVLGCGIGMLSLHGYLRAA